MNSTTAKNRKACKPLPKTTKAAELRRQANEAKLSKLNKTVAHLTPSNYLVFCNFFDKRETFRSTFIFVYEIYHHVNLFVLVSLPYFSLGYNFKFWLTESPVNFRNILNSLLPFCNPLELISVTFRLNQAHGLWLILYFNVRKSEPVYTGFSSDADMGLKKDKLWYKYEKLYVLPKQKLSCVGISLTMNIRDGSGVTIYYRILYPEPNRKSVKT